MTKETTFRRTNCKEEGKG